MDTLEDDEEVNRATTTTKKKTGRTFQGCKGDLRFRLGLGLLPCPVDVADAAGRAFVGAARASPTTLFLASIAFDDAAGAAELPSGADAM